MFNQETEYLSAYITTQKAPFGILWVDRAGSLVKPNREAANTVHAHPTMAEAIWFTVFKGKPFNSTEEFMVATEEQQLQ